MPLYIFISEKRQIFIDGNATAFPPPLPEKQGGLWLGDRLRVLLSDGVCSLYFFQFPVSTAGWFQALLSRCMLISDGVCCYYFLNIVVLMTFKNFIKRCKMQATHGICECRLWILGLVLKDSYWHMMVSILLIRDGFHFSVTKRMGLMHSIIRPREFLSELLGTGNLKVLVSSLTLFNKRNCSILTHTQIYTLPAKHTHKQKCIAAHTQALSSWWSLPRVGVSVLPSSRQGT